MITCIWPKSPNLYLFSANLFKIILNPIASDFAEFFVLFLRFVKSFIIVFLFPKLNKVIFVNA